MTTPTAALTPSTLAEALRANPWIERWERAAVELLIWHETWIRLLAPQPSTTAGPLVVVDEDDAGRCARINWRAFHAWVASGVSPAAGGAAQRVALLAASLAGNTPVELADVAGDGMGKATKRACLAAITAAFGDVDDDPVWRPDGM